MFIRSPVGVANKMDTRIAINYLSVCRFFHILYLPNTEYVLIKSGCVRHDNRCMANEILRIIGGVDLLV